MKRTGKRITGRTAFVALAAILVCCFYASAESGDKIPYPKEYRKWVHVKSTLIGPQHASFAKNGGIHHFYANEKAMEGYRSGEFPDGSILIDDLLEIKENAGVTSEGARRRVAVMTKESQRYPETGGWGFEIFAGDSQGDGVLTAEARKECFACHQKGRDSVFSQFRK
jgi:hypothetical protein